MLTQELQTQLAAYGITNFDEVELRKALEVHLATYTLFKLAPWAARRWKCHYRLMTGGQVYDAQDVAEAYALGLLAALQSTSSTAPT